MTCAHGKWGALMHRNKQSGSTRDAGRLQANLSQLLTPMAHHRASWEQASLHTHLVKWDCKLEVWRSRACRLPHGISSAEKNERINLTLVQRHGEHHIFFHIILLYCPGIHGSVTRNLKEWGTWPLLRCTKQMKNQISSLCLQKNWGEFEMDYY
jgi:hypothetical protein